MLTDRTLLHVKENLSPQTDVVKSASQLLDTNMFFVPLCKNVLQNTMV